MPEDKFYINDTWESIFNIIKDNLTSYTVDIKPLNSGVASLSNNTILILYPRISRFGQKKTYNEEQRKTFRINLFCLSNNTDGYGVQSATKMVGELSSFVEHNQHLFAMEGLQFPQIISEEPISINMTETQQIVGYLCVLQGRILV